MLEFYLTKVNRTDKAFAYYSNALPCACQHRKGQGILDEDILGKSMVIYLITNTITDKQYVGQTRQKLKERINQHRRSQTLLIGQVIAEYGWENFSVKILDVCKNLTELNERERHWISTLGTLVPNGYNKTVGGSGGRINRKKQSKGRTHLRSSVLCVEKNVVFKSISAAAKWAGVARSAIQYAIKDETGTVKKCHWRLLERSKVPYSNKKIAVRCVETGIIFPSISEAARQMGINGSNISAVIPGRKQTAGDFHWEVADEYYKDEAVRQHNHRAVLCVETGRVFQSIADAARWARVKQSGISRVLVGKRKTCGGYTWRYADLDVGSDKI